MQWRLFVEEFTPIFHYVKGADNAFADALSRLPAHEGQSEHRSPLDHSSPMDRMSSYHYDDDDLHDHTYTALVHNDEMLQCMLNFPETEMHKPFLLDYDYIAAAQTNDRELMSRLVKEPHHYNWLTVAPLLRVVAHVQHPDDNPKICIPDVLLDEYIKFYHLALAHAGMNKVMNTLAMHFWHADLRSKTEQIIHSCEVCQKTKPPWKGYGHLAPREAHVAPWREVAIDLIGPWEMQMHDYTLSFRALTIIDTVTNYCEVVRITNKKSTYIGQMFENTWLSRYPRPMHCIFDQGGEFIGAGFQAVLHRHGIHPHPTTSKNPQANAICERLHQTIANAIRALTHTNPPRDLNDASLLVDTAISTAAYAARAAVHNTLHASPGSLAFHWDMFLDIPIIADLHLLQHNRQILIDKQLMKANVQRIAFDYQPGQQVLKLVADPDKLQPRYEGPYTVTTVHTNGTITIQLTPQVQERINIRCICPYHHH